MPIARSMAGPARLLLAALAVLVALGCAAAPPDDSGGPQPPADSEFADSEFEDRGPTDSAIVAEAQQLLDTLPIKGRAPKTGYDREEQFGSAWQDVDANGCDTRNDILQRDLTNIELRDACIVESGVLDDPYSGQLVPFVRGPDSADVQIDHVVALSNAWQTGAQQLTYAERVSFANDPLGLLAVDGALNQQKGAGDAATWLPPDRSFWCEYVAIQVLVKERWGLWLTPPEHATIDRILAGC